MILRILVGAVVGAALGFGWYKLVGCSSGTCPLTSNPFISTIGYLLPYIVSGSIIVSLVLSLPTVGPLLLKALVAQDMFLAGTIVLLLGVMTVIGTFISDLLLMWVDPRIRLGGE